MVTFNNTAVKIQQKIHFQPKVINFFLGYIPIFDTKISEMKN